VSGRTREAEYLATLIEPIRVSASYRPKLGRGQGSSLSKAEFQNLYRSDPFYAWYGLDSALMYAAHKAAGGMTSVYRQIGIGAERLFRRVLQDELGLDEDQVRWSYETKTPAGKTRKLSLDGRIDLADVADRSKARKVEEWLRLAAEDLGVAPAIRANLRGVVFEVRQGYKSKDSKRQNADIANASTAYTQAYLPCVAVLSTQIDTSIVTRYRNERWALLVGSIAEDSTLRSTYSFAKNVVGFDLGGFFARHSATLSSEVHTVLTALLSVEK
jgi:hypothetical protein